MVARLYLLLLFLVAFVVKFAEAEAVQYGRVGQHERFIKKDRRRILSSSDSGHVSAVEVKDAYGRRYPLHFFSLEPDSLFLPVLLHADMIFYVNTGRGNVGWIDGSMLNNITVERGDVYRLPTGSVFYLQSESQAQERFRIHAIFTTNKEDETIEPFTGTYSPLTDLVVGFDRKILETAFRVPGEIMESIARAERPAAIVHNMERAEAKKDGHEWAWKLMESLVDSVPLVLGGHHHHKHKKQHKPLNLLRKKPNFSNFYGWSLAVDHKEFGLLKGSNMGLFVVNLTKGSMMGPHWNPRATEIGVVIYGGGIIQVVSPDQSDRYMGSRFKVEEGDVFSVSRFEPMAQISYDNDSLVFMGFSTMSRKNNPQFLAGRSSVLQTLGEEIVGLSLNANRSHVREFMQSQSDAIILACPYCAVEEEKLITEETEEEGESRRKREEEERRKREEEQREREEEEGREREEERRKREEEEQRKKEEEEGREREEKQREREEEEGREREEERRKREEEDRKREEEEGREREERRRKEEEERKEKEAEERRRREEEEEGGGGGWRKALRGKEPWY